MPFVARDATTGIRIDITEIDDPRRTLADRALVCQLCAEPMMVKTGEIRIQHFAHYATCASAYDWQGETLAHLRSKTFAKTWLHTQPAFLHARIELECAIPSLKRIADVMAIFPDGRQFAIEIQLSSITVGMLEQRTADYRDLDIPVLWWFGGAGDTPATRQWCVKRRLECGRVTFHEDAPSLRRIPETTQPFVLRVFYQYHASPFIACASCGVLVQRRTWQTEEGWTRLATPVSAALGTLHRCPTVTP